MTDIRTPAHIEPFVRVLGPDLAVEFLLTFGGAELYLAPRPQRRSRLVGLVGMDKATELGRVADRLPARIPTAKPWIILMLKARGQPVAEIARTLHMSNVAVRRHLRAGGVGPDLDTDKRQLSLF